MVLVTTALKETFPEKNITPVLFLGEWCKIYSQKAHWSQYKSNTLDYHWDQQDEALKGISYTNEIYEKYLSILSKQLNKIHNKNYSDRYWRILIGYWLRQFVDIVYDRHLILERAFSEYKIDKTYVLDFESYSATPLDMNDFNAIKSGDEWNHFIYTQLIANRCELVKISKEKHKIERVKENSGFYKSIVKKIK